VEKNLVMNFIIIGENIHTTRVIKRKGIKSHIFDDGKEAIKYKNENEIKYVIVPEHFYKTQPFEQGNLKHFLIALWKCLNEPSGFHQGASYILYEVNRQIKHGANYLDVNVDEFSYKLDEQKKAMAWIVKFIEKYSTKPLCIDSSNPEIIDAGLRNYSGKCGDAMLNSIALERPETIDLAKKYNTKVIVSAASESGMPEDESQRMENIVKIVDMCINKGLNLEEIFIDPLIFPVSVNSLYPTHIFKTINLIRNEYGEKIHITGGISNVSFGIPNRKLINHVFLSLCIDEGLDSGIIDPISTSVESAININKNDQSVILALDLLTGNDEFAMNYISNFRSGKLQF
tara:strand:+ start:16648 stop:17679 length:1032 start_codon:yes stop_codon:yes gene_type:complete